ncbi:MAG: OmpA family protein [Treponema sp.]|nr:OmpA family protein [Treponema sp.]
MAESELHEKDTRNAVHGTTNTENIKLIQDLVYLVIDANIVDGQYKGANTLTSIFKRIEKFGFTKEKIYDYLLETGVSSSQLQNERYNNDIDKYLQEWLLIPSTAEHKHLFTHKGADYRYDVREEDNQHDLWTGKEKQQSWEVKKKLLKEIIIEIYSISPTIADKIAMTLYSIHRLRDLQYNGAEKTPLKEYYVNIVDDLINYTIPLVESNKIKDIKENIDELKNNIIYTRNTRNWDNLFMTIDNLLGSEHSNSGGLLSEVIPDFFRPEAPKLTWSEKSESEVELNWGRVKNARFYRIFKDDVMIKESDDELSYNLNNLQPDKEYICKAMCLTEYGLESKFSDIITIKTNEKIIKPPRLSGSAISESEIALKWSKIKDAKYYKIYKDEVMINESSDHSYNLGNLQPDTRYYFKVKSIAENGKESKFSKTVKIKTKKKKEEDKVKRKKEKEESLRGGDSILKKIFSIIKNFIKGILKGVGAIFAKILPFLPFIFKAILIAVGIALIVLLILFLLRQCDSNLEPVEPPVAVIIERVPEPIIIPSLTYSNIHFVRDTRFFLSEGNHYTNTAPDMSEGHYEHRLGEIAGDMKNILAIRNDQIFIITGYAAGIYYDDGELFLSTQRADKVRDILVNLGIPAENLRCVYMGGTNRWGNNLTEETQRYNRVVTIEIME